MRNARYALHANCEIALNLPLSRNKTGRNDDSRNARERDSSYHRIFMQAFASNRARAEILFACRNLNVPSHLFKLKQREAHKGRRVSIATAVYFRNLTQISIGDTTLFVRCLPPVNPQKMQRDL